MEPTPMRGLEEHSLQVSAARPRLLVVVWLDRSFNVVQVGTLLNNLNLQPPEYILISYLIVG